MSVKLKTSRMDIIRNSLRSVSIADRHAIISKTTDPCPSGSTTARIKKEGAMRDLQGQIHEWISRNSENLIRCPHQPGNLLITKSSCRRRRLKAQKEDLANVMSGDVMDYIYRQGLSICLTCNALKKAAA
jgi:hypothetical protein